jgi:tetratricopeptide (TPR) repeat protein
MGTCFVIQGFGEKTDFTNGRKLNLDASYAVIKEAVQDAGLECIRADEIQHSGIIDTPMYQHLLNADVVIADLSTYNVNAAYELGVRHALRPYATIVIAETEFNYPFDFNHIVFRTYTHLGKEGLSWQEANRFIKELKAAIIEIISAQKTDSPVYTFLPDLAPPSVFSAVNSSTDVTNAANVSLSNGSTDQNAKQLLDLARQAMMQDNFGTAKPLFEAILQMRPNDEYVIQQLALATYKHKQPDPKTALLAAHKILQTLKPETTNDPETLGLWGAIHKKLWELEHDRKFLDEAITAYERGFYLKQDYYNGINVAFLLNERAAVEEQTGTRAEAIADFVQAQRIRREVMKYCKNQLELANGTKTEEERYWIVATLWEAAVGIEDVDAEKQWSERAAAMKVADWMLVSTQEQIAKLKKLLSDSPLRYLNG